MRIKCIATLRENISAEAQKLYFVAPDFQIPIGRVFIVYSISIWQGVVHYLIVVDNEHQPDWYPADLFIIEDSRLPEATYYGYFGPQDKRGVYALCGYQEMVVDNSHYRDLIEREEQAIEVFLRRKELIDKI